MIARHSAILETIVTLAEEIARASPECADKAMKIADLAGEIHVGGLDRTAVQDAIELELADSDMSDVRLASATDAVLKAVRER